MFSSGPKYQKLTTNLRLAINRLKLLEKKKTELAVKARREIADYIKNGKEDRARIRVEHIVREDYLVEAMEIIEMYCDLLIARMGVLQTTKGVDEGLEESIASIIWATPRLQSDVQELVTISDQLALKYGKEYAASCRSNSLNNVNEKLIHKLSIHAPPKVLVEKYMEEIAKSFNIPYISPADPECQAADLLFNKLDDFLKSDNKKGSGGDNNNNDGGIHFPAIPEASNTINGVPNNYHNNIALGGLNNNNNQPFNYPPQQPQNNYPMPNSAPYPINNPLYPVPQPRAFQPAGLPNLPQVPTNTVRGPTDNKDEINFDELTKRFEDLKNKK